MESQFAQSIRSLAAEQRFGAARIAEIAADILLRRAGTGQAASPDAFRHEMLQTGLEIIRAQPTMAPLVNLVSSVLWKVEQAEVPRELYEAVAEATEAFKRQLRQHAVHVAEGALGLIEDDSQVITTSFSSTVQVALLHALRAGRHFSVACGESRPICEGRQTAQALAAAGVPVTLMTDAALVAAVPHARLILVGADMLSTGGLTNKSGTYALALAARASGVPFYTLCGSEKFLPATFQPLEQRDWPADEIWERPPPNVQIANRYFDETPLDLITGIVTERGTLPAAAIEAWLAAIKLHPALTDPALTLVEQQ